MLLFQLVDPGKVADRAFGIDPTNIFGFLVGGLVIIIAVLGYVVVALYRRGESREKRLEELTINITTVAVNATQVLDSLVHSVDKLPSHIESHKAEIKQEVKNAKDDILRTIDNLKK